MKKDEFTGLNIWQKLAIIRKQVEVIRKNKDGYGYKYVSEDEILAKVSVLMDKLSLSLFPEIVPETTEVSPYSYTKMKKGVEEKAYDIIVSSEMKFSWVNNDNPEERVTVPWVLVGQQADAAQAFGSGLTYANRYFLLKFFNIATPDADPDNFRTKQKQTELDADKAAAAEIIAELKEKSVAYVGEDKSRAEAVKTLIKKYVKSGNWNDITEAAVAAKLLREFTETFLDKKEKTNA